MDKSQYKNVYVFVEQRDGVVQNVALELLGKARELAERASGDSLAMGLLAYIYAFEEDYLDDAAAQAWASLAAAKADSLGQFVLGWLYMNGYAVEKDYAAAWAYISLANEKAPDLKKGAEDDTDLIAALEDEMSPEDRLRAKQLRQEWLAAWGLEDTLAQ